MSPERPENLEGLKQLLMRPISIMLIFVPFGIASKSLGWSDTVTFWINFFAMVPLAKVLGDATEELGKYTNQLVTGLINSTLGNAVEMIMTVNLLREHQYLVIKASMLGSVLSNMLLVLGMSFLLGGLKYRPEQSFNKLGSSMWTTMLLLACLLLIILTLFAEVQTINACGDPTDALDETQLKTISRMCSIMLILSYIASLVFTLKTHAAEMDEGEDQEEGRLERIEAHVGLREVVTHREQAEEDEDKEEEEEEKLISAWVAMALLMLCTVIVAVSSECLTGSMEGALEGSGMGKEFLGIILLPIVGNACEHAGAVRMAMNDKVDITIGIAIGSSTQIALFVVPFAVIVGWAIDQPMDLDLGALYTTIMMMAVLITFSVVSDGTTNWLEGFMLMIAYAVVATLFWFLPESRAA